MKKLMYYVLFVSFIGALLNCKTDQNQEDEVNIIAEQTNISTDEVGTSPAKEETAKDKDFTAYFPDEIEIDGFESCGFGEYEKSKITFPFSYVEEFDLVQLDYEKDYKEFLINDISNVKFFPIAKKKMEEMYVLVYGTEYNKNEVYIGEYRIVLYQDNEIIKNILFSLDIADEGESILCRKLLLFPNRIELIMTESENVDYLEIKQKETYYFNSTVKAEATISSKN